MKDWQTVLFLCTGNFYRSRYAEAWFNYHAPRCGLSWRAESRGFRPHLATETLSHHAEERLIENTVPLSLTRPYPEKILLHDLAEASLVIALLEGEHRPMVHEQFPDWIDRIRYWNVHDIDVKSPQHALPLIEAEVEALIQNLKGGHALGARKGFMVEF